MSLQQVHYGIKACRACPLHAQRRNAVPGEGPALASLAIVGEAPGWEEDNKARPFVGQAGRLLDELLDGIGLSRNEFYILNVINCRPPKNRDPKQSELESCRHWLWDQLDLVSPKVVLAAGRYASLAFVPDITPAHIRGTAMKLGDVIYYFSYHPAAALHNPGLRPELERQFAQLKTLL